MLLPTHLLVGYVLGRRWDLPVIWIVAGAALPDVVDKPLAMAGVSVLYQTVGHSLLGLGVGAVVLLAGRKGLALWVGWASHLVLDAVHMVVNGRPEDVRFLVWPVVEHVPTVNLPPIEFLFHYLWTPSFALEVALWLVVAGWLAYGRASGARAP